MHATSGLVLGLKILASLVFGVAAPGDAPRLDPQPSHELEVLHRPEVAQIRVTPLIGWGLDMHNNPSLSLGGRIEYSPARAFGVELFGAYLRPGEPSDLTLTKLQRDGAAPKTQMLSVVGASVRLRPIYGALRSPYAVVGRFRVDVGVGAGFAVTRAECTRGAV